MCSSCEWNTITKREWKNAPRMTYNTRYCKEEKRGQFWVKGNVLVPHTSKKVVEWIGLKFLTQIFSLQLYSSLPCVLLKLIYFSTLWYIIYQFTIMETDISVWVRSGLVFSEILLCLKKTLGERKSLIWARWSLAQHPWLRLSVDPKLIRIYFHSRKNNLLLEFVQKQTT